MSKIDDIANKTFTVDKNGNITNIGIDVTKKNKELTPLDALDELHCVAYGMKVYDHNTIKAEKIIETALKRLEELERENFELSEQVGMYATYKGEDEGRLKAVEIIKPYIEIHKYEHMNARFLIIKEEAVEINKEQYDLLKEFFND